EMGNPVRILDLANQMIRLAGLRPGEDIEIAIIGARPGERTHERLHDDGEIVGTTDHPAIRGLSPRQTLDLPSIHASLELLGHQCELGDDHAAVLLLDAMLRDAGVPCHLEENMQVELDSLTIETVTAAADGDDPVLAAPLTRDRRPAVLGGAPAFPRPLPLVDPPRPVLDRVMARLAPSYDRGMLTNGPLVAELEERAADPCSVMGATKRAAELVVLAVGTEHGLPFAAVRFGNVLGSRGSVVPTFFRQILEGGPVTVTDPEMTRYFMTIPEAVSLVLQAGSMAEHRKVFLLEMGNPVRILDLANQMIRLAGLRPGEDIEIAIIGARPGERTHERLHDD
ncbi:MAG: polysaccharide biosynthesis protein, partial [Actinomycetota bacterium]